MTRGAPQRILLLTLLLLVLAAGSRAKLDAYASQLVPPVAAVGDFVREASGAWAGHEIFPVSRRTVVLAAIADGTWPAPERVWPEQASYTIGDGLYSVGPDLNGAMMLYSTPSADGRSAWLASPGRDGVWASGAEDPLAAAKAIDQLARRVEDGALLRIRAGAKVTERWSYNIRWGDDHIVLFQVMLSARGRHDAIVERLAAFPNQMPRIEHLHLPQIWADQSADAATLLDAVVRQPTS